MVQLSAGWQIVIKQWHKPKLPYKALLMQSDDQCPRIAVSRKMAVIMLGMCKTGSAFEPGHT
jgi:hypothetical protein